VWPLLVIDDLVVHGLEVTETSDFYELPVEWQSRVTRDLVDACRCSVCSKCHRSGSGVPRSSG
jgi:hypothetical protein